MSEPNTCLTCRFLSEPDEPHLYHQCLWPESNQYPKAMGVVSIHIWHPLTDCPCWERREVQG